MARKKKKAGNSDERRSNRRELEHRMCYRYTQLRNFRAVAKEFGTHPETVRRAWDRLSETERNDLIGTADDIRDNLNDRILVAETAAGDPFIRDIMEARIAAGKELKRRFRSGVIETISDKDFASLLRLAASITAAVPDDDTKNHSVHNTFRTLRDSIDEDINKINQQ